MQIVSKWMFWKYMDFWKQAILPSWPFSGSYVAALDEFSIGRLVWSRL